MRLHPAIFAWTLLALFLAAAYLDASTYLETGVLP